MPRSTVLSTRYCARVISSPSSQTHPTSQHRRDLGDDPAVNELGFWAVEELNGNAPVNTNLF